MLNVKVQRLLTLADILLFVQVVSVSFATTVLTVTDNNIKIYFVQNKPRLFYVQGRQFNLFRGK